jgi:hypothetical protein
MVVIIVIGIVLSAILLPEIGAGIPTPAQHHISTLLCKKLHEDKVILKLFEDQQVTLDDIKWGWHYRSITISYYVNKKEFDPSPIVQQTRNLALQIDVISQTALIHVEFIYGTPDTNSIPFKEESIKLQ